MVEVSAGCGTLDAWSGRDAVGDRGAVLWREFWLRAARMPDVWSVPFDPNRPVAAPNTLNIASTGVRQALADAVLRLAQLHVPVDAPLSAAQYTTVGGGEPPVPGAETWRAVMTSPRPPTPVCCMTTAVSAR
jgi:acyl-homoserine-lactone acylase